MQVSERIGEIIDGVRRRVALRTRLRRLSSWIRLWIRGIPRSARPWDGARTLLDSLAIGRAVTVIIPVHNAPDELERCLRSVLRNTRRRGVQVLIIDDASTDPEVREVLAAFADADRITILRNEENLGYTRTVNRGLARSLGDVVLLNSDTEVTPRWLDNLVVAAYQDPLIATVTPLSNNAGAFSAPVIAEDNRLPTHLDPDDVGRLVTRSSGRRYPDTPTGNGYCMLIKEPVVRTIGPFDVRISPRGYGEENDFCMRAIEAGWRHVVDDATYVLHEGSSSFGAESERLGAVARREIDGRHPQYTEMVREFVGSRALSDARRAVGDAFQRSVVQHERPRPRVLYVLHSMTGGAPHMTLDLARANALDLDSLVLLSDTESLRLLAVRPSGLDDVGVWKLRRPLRPDDIRRADYREIVLTLLLDHDIELVHVQHLLGHTFDLPDVAQLLDIPVVLTLHDYYYSCPTVHLLDDQDRFCGGRCTEGQGECRLPVTWLRELPHLKHGWVHVWRREVERMLDNVDAFVTATRTTEDVYVRSLPNLERERIHRIEPGVATKTRLPEPRGVRGDRIRIAVPGNLDIHKGSEFIRQIAEVDRGQRIEFHFLGRSDPTLDGIGVQHGTYEREDLGRRLRELDPALVGLFSIWGETYSYTLTESWAAGIPVVAADVGALHERIDSDGGGWLVDPQDPRAALREIIRIAEDVEEYETVRSSISMIRIPDRQEMAHRHQDLYEQLLNARSLRGAVPSSRNTRLRVALVLPGRRGPFISSVHVRLLRRLGHPAIRRHVSTDITTAEQMVHDHGPPFDLVLIQRNGVPPELTEPLLTALDERSIPFALDLDDDLFALRESEHDDAGYGPYVEGLERLAAAADLVTVSTDLLGERLRGGVQRLEVVPNLLDEHLWFQDPTEPVAGGDDAAFRLLYMGSTTHVGDLEILRPAMERLRRHGIELDVVGIRLGSSWGGWWRRVTVPESATSYPAFVQWLRRQRGTWDAAVAPLEDTRFNRAKSDLKFLDYAALGLPGVFSDVVPYETVEDGVTGLKVPNEAGAWVDALSQLAADRSLGNALAGRARSYVRNERCLGSGAHLEEYVALLRSVVDDS